MSGRHYFGTAIAALGVLISVAAGAQEYPTRPITLIVPWPAGGFRRGSCNAAVGKGTEPGLRRAHDGPKPPELARYPVLELSLIIYCAARSPSVASPLSWSLLKFRHSGCRRQTNCRMGVFQPMPLPVAMSAAVNKLFFSGNFGKDCARK